MASLDSRSANDSLLKNASHYAIWLMVWLPALAVLNWLHNYGTPLPYHDDWEFVKQYRLWTQGEYSWMDLFRPINGQPLAVPKAVFFAALHWNNGDISILPYLSWAMSLGVALGVWWMSRRWRQELPGNGWYVVLLWNLGIFSAAQEGTWFWNCTFHTYIPGFCLVMGLVALTSKLPLPVRMTFAAMASIIATFSFGAGFVVPMLLSATVWWQVRNHVSPSGKSWVIVGWLALTGFLIYAALFAFPGSGGGDGLGDQLVRQGSRPVLTLSYGLLLLGSSLSAGTALEPTTLGMLLGAVFLTAVLVCVIRLMKGETASEMIPWLTLCGWAACNAGLITIMRLNHTLDTALAPRYATHMHFFVTGLAGLFALAFWVRGRAVKPWLPATATILLMLQLAAWADGLEMMWVRHRQMMQERAVLSFAKIMALPPGLLWSSGSPQETLDTAQFLSAKGLVRNLKFMETTNPQKFRMGTPLPDKWGSWQLLQNEAGELLARGTCGSSKTLDTLPDLIVLTTAASGGPERIAFLVRPIVPDDFKRRAGNRRRHSEHYFGWNYRLPAGTSSAVNAYAYYGDKYQLRAIPKKKPTVGLSVASH